MEGRKEEEYNSLSSLPPPPPPPPPPREFTPPFLPPASRSMNGGHLVLVATILWGRGRGSKFFHTGEEKKIIKHWQFRWQCGNGNGRDSIKVFSSPSNVCTPDDATTEGCGPSPSSSSDFRLKKFQIWQKMEDGEEEEEEEVVEEVEKEDGKNPFLCSFPGGLRSGGRSPIK